MDGELGLMKNENVVADDRCEREKAVMEIRRW